MASISDIVNRSVSTREMHTAGEPLRIIESVSPNIELRGATLLEKRRYFRTKLDWLRKMVVNEPRGHHDMYAAFLTAASDPTADFGVLFMHNEGYSTMCGHAIIALARYLVDEALVKKVEPETFVSIQCPCGVVKAWVEVSEGITGGVRFESVPAFLLSQDVVVTMKGGFEVKVDIAYGGAFYAIVTDEALGVSFERGDSIGRIIEAATKLKKAITDQEIPVNHPLEPEMSFLYGVIVTDGKDSAEDTRQLCIFADGAVDRSPTGSGVTARLAAQVTQNKAYLWESRRYINAALGSSSMFTGRAVRSVQVADKSGFVIEVSGRAFYSGQAVFTNEADDVLGAGFKIGPHDACARISGTI